MCSGDTVHVYHCSLRVAVNAEIMAFKHALLHKSRCLCSGSNCFPCSVCPGLPDMWNSSRNLGGINRNEINSMDIFEPRPRP